MAELKAMTMYRVPHYGVTLYLGQAKTSANIPWQLSSRDYVVVFLEHRVDGPRCDAFNPAYDAFNEWEPVEPGSWQSEA